MVINMKKKITQWFIGLLLCIVGFCTCVIGIYVGYGFINVINTTGKECIGYFIGSVIFLLIFLLLPYVVFHTTKDGVLDKWK